MIAKSYIEKSLQELDILYNQATSQKKSIYFSKLALIELCGWIEETLDDIIIRHANRNLKEQINKTYCKKQIVKPNYGFEYERNLRPMLIKLIGLINIEKMEKSLEKTAQITLLTTYLQNLKTTRNDAAHTHLKGVTRRYNAPSQTLGDYRNICAILETLDASLRSY